MIGFKRRARSSMLYCTRVVSLHLRRTRCRIEHAALELIAGEKLTKSRPFLLRAERGLNVYPRKSKLVQSQLSTRFASLQYTTFVFSGWRLSLQSARRFSIRALTHSNCVRDLQCT